MSLIKYDKAAIARAKQTDTNSTKERIRKTYTSSRDMNIYDGPVEDIKKEPSKTCVCGRPVPNGLRLHVCLCGREYLGIYWRH